METNAAGQLATLFRPVGQKELDLIRQSGMTAFPARLPHQPIFYPVLSESYQPVVKVVYPLESVIELYIL